MRPSTGAEMAALHDREFIEVADGTNVFARVTPEQKLRLVEALQSKGQVVAMTGDGVNDAPALKQADIGVAMGITGTDVAKDAADMVLTDDDFASIEAAVEEGRGVFDNLVKFIAYALPTNVGQGLVLLAGIVLGTALPIEPLQILWINMITAVLLGLGLAFEPKEPGIMDRPPRAPGSAIVTRAVMVRIVIAGLILLVCAFGIFEWAEGRDLGDAGARTAAVNVFMSVQIFYLFACRSLRRSLFTYNPFGNPIILLGVAVVIVLQLLFTYAPFMNVAFGTASISAGEWVVILVIGLGTMVFMDLIGVRAAPAADPVGIRRSAHDDAVVRTGAHPPAQRGAQPAGPRDPQLHLEPLHVLPRVQGDEVVAAAGGGRPRRRRRHGGGRGGAAPPRRRRGARGPGAAARRIRCRSSWATGRARSSCRTRTRARSSRRSSRR